MSTSGRRGAARTSGRSPGFRLRQKRREQGITQAALAAQVGISASYLNLIEHAKRDVAGALLRRLADALGLELSELTGQEEVRLTQDLADVAADPGLRDLRLDEPGAHEIVARRPGWGQAIVRLHRRQQAAATLAESLAQRLAHDATLVQASHQLLTRMTSVRSFAEILREHTDLEAGRRDRYVGLIAEESARLGDVAKSLFDRLSDFGESVRATTPVEEVDDFVIGHANHFPELELRAEALGEHLRKSGTPLEEALVERLRNRHGVRVELRRARGEDAGGHSPVFDLERRTFRAPRGGPAPTRRFQLARAVFRLEEPSLIAGLVDDARLTSLAARERASGVLSSYGAGALLFPYEEFLAAARDCRYDLDRLSALFDASIEQVCHRLVTLRRPGAEGIPFGFLRVDPAGNISKRFSLPSLHLPRFGGVCPLWAVYRGFRSLGSLVAQRVRLPDGREFLFVARAFAKPARGFGMPTETYSVMIACDAIHASETVYGDAAGGDPRTALRSGINCHLCPRDDCPQRAFPQVVPEG